MKMKNICYIIALFFVMSACTDLDLPPKSILADEDIYNDVGIEAYMAGMYRMLPMNDFKTSDDGGSINGYFNWNCTVWETNGTGEGFGKNNTGGITLHRKDYWNDGWKIIRNANRMITNLPAYESTMPKAKEWIAESKFIRAYLYFTLATRYGGLPIISEMQDFDSEFSNLWVARSSCEATWDFILSDLDAAIEGLPESYGNVLVNRTRATKNVALAFKSKAALFAGSIAKYGGGKSSGEYIESRNHIFYSRTDPSLMLCGIPEGRANSYYEQAWRAAKALEGKYSLVGQNAASAEEKENAYTQVFSEADVNTEAIFIRKYSYNDFVHSFDVVYSPMRHVGTYGNRYQITLDWMELFDGKNPDTGRDFVNPATGRLNVMDGNNFHVYNSAAELYEGAEPRLRACILVPMQTYRGAKTDMRWGVINEDIDPSTPIEKVYPDNYETNSDYNVNTWPFYAENILLYTEGKNPVEQANFVITANGDKIARNGYDGPGPAQWGDYNRTGIWGRKWLDMKLTKANLGAVHTSNSSWIDIRYAEVLLNRAEAAIEMHQNGHSFDGGNMQDDAFTCINLIRSRAGADLLSSSADLSTDPAFDRRKNATVDATNPGKGGFVFAPNRGVQIVRVERYKELNYEHKLYWDLRRWFSFDLQINAYRARALMPFMFAKGAVLTAPDGTNMVIPDGKYIYDLRGAQSFDRKTFNTNGDRSYYENIPTGELSKNPLLEGNVRQ
jgi:SusD family.